MYVSGKLGYVQQNGVNRGFSKWSFPMKAGTPKVTNFNSAGFAAFVVGIAEATGKIDGPYDVGNCPFSLGSTYTFNFGLTNAVFLTASAIVNSIEPNNDVEDTPHLSIGLQVTGPFTFTVP